MPPIDSSASREAANALKAIPYGDIIGAPLIACIQAQAKAAETTVNFIQQVGLNTDENGHKEAVVVSFTFDKEGAKTQLNVPLLTIVPIPYIAINSVEISFKASISASATSSQEDNSSSSFSTSAKVSASYKGRISPYSASAEFSANYSSKKDSKATQDSKYSVEYTMDIHVQAGQESLPAGLAKVLEVLNSSISVKALEPAKESAAADSAE
ncbi:MAG: DUF2589 domain-containing protein [Prevotellaceae bacterium]|jgi:hypothetical protein|nr:DUF2589 domain-containing protein [Prevotellaceae bacterium]